MRKLLTTAGLLATLVVFSSAQANPRSHRCDSVAVPGGRIHHITTTGKCRTARDLVRYWWRGGRGEGYMRFRGHRWYISASRGWWRGETYRPYSSVSFRAPLLD